MLGAYLLPARLRASSDTGASAKPKWLNRQVTPILLSLSRRACIHPIYTLVFVAILASTTYLGLLDSSLFEQQASIGHAAGRVDFNILLNGSKRLFTGPETGWKWLPEENGKQRDANEVR
jgi:hydroxymethylglutaryl-CoA reductase (NADPH)